MVTAASSSTTLLRRNPFVLRTLSPVPLDHGFHHIHLAASPPRNIIQSARTSDLPTNSLSIDASVNPSSIHSDLFQYYYYSLDPLDGECLHLSGRPLASVTARILTDINDDKGATVNLFVAFPYNQNTISVIFPAEKEIDLYQILQETPSNAFRAMIKHEGEMLCSGTEMKEAFTWGLREALVRDGWIVFEGNLAVWNGLDQTQSWLNGEPTEVVEFSIQTDTNDRVDFFLSPDVIRFRPFKIEELLPEPLRREFHNGSTVILDKWLENMAPDDRKKWQCIVVPSMKEGFVSACSKSAPEALDMKSLEQICTAKYGPLISSEVFYIQASFSCEEEIIRVWFPSCLVLQRPGVIVSPPSVRRSKVILALEKIVSCISRKESESWNWTPARSILLQDSSLTEDKKLFDFGSCVRSLDSTFLQTIRRQKPESFHADIAAESSESSSSNSFIKNDKMPLLSGNSVQKANLPSNLRIPIFLKKKIKGNSLRENHKQSNRKPLGTASIKENKKSESDTTAIFNDLQASGPRKKISVCFPLGNEKSHVSKLMEAYPTSASKTEVIGNIDEIEPGLNPNDSIKESVVPRKKASKRQSQEKQSTVQQKKKKKTDPEKVTNSTQLKLNPPKEDIIFTAPSNDKTAMIASSQEDGSHLNVGPQVNIASVQVSLQANMTSMIACPQENVLFTPIKETATVAKLPESSKEKKPLKQSEKKSNGDLNVKEINQKISSKYAEGKLSDLTVPELKCFLSANKTKVSGRKEELIQRIMAIMKESPLS